MLRFRLVLATVMAFGLVLGCAAVNASVSGWESLAAVIERQKGLWRRSCPGVPSDLWSLSLTSTEQLTCATMCAMFAVPLTNGCGSTNSEVVAIERDRLGAVAACLEGTEDWEVWARPLSDGSIAAALYNKTLRPRRIVLRMEALGIMCKWRIRDVWSREDEGVFLGEYDTIVGGHAAHLIRLTPLPCGHLREGMTDIRRR